MRPGFGQSCDSCLEVLFLHNALSSRHLKEARTESNRLSFHANLTTLYLAKLYSTRRASERVRYSATRVGISVASGCVVDVWAVCKRIIVAFERAQPIGGVGGSCGQFSPPARPL